MWIFVKLGSHKGGCLGAIIGLMVTISLIITCVRGCTYKVSIIGAPNRVKISYVDKAESDEKSRYQDGYVTALTLKLKNKTGTRVDFYKGEIAITDANKQQLFKGNFQAEVFADPRKEETFVLHIDPEDTDAAYLLYFADPQTLNITVRPVEITFDMGRVEEFPKAKAKTVLKASSKGSGQVSSVLERKTDDIVNAFRNADPFTTEYITQMNSAVSQLEQLWNAIKGHDALLEKLYAEGNSYLSQGQEEKAYYLFSMLELAPYKDSSAKSDEAYLKASTLSYDSRKPGKIGIVFSVGACVQTVEDDYDADSKMFYGDIIVEVDGHSLDSTDLEEYLLTKRAGDTVTLGVYRQDQFITVPVRLGYRYF